MSHTAIEFSGNIASIRAVEDCIRATKKYTKVAFRKRAQQPIQGEDFPSKVVPEYYEVYPDVDLDEKRSLLGAIGTTFEWLTGYSTHIVVTFRYDYRANKASVKIKDGIKGLWELKRAIPNFNRALSAINNGNGTENKNKGA